MPTAHPASPNPVPTTLVHMTIARRSALRAVRRLSLAAATEADLVGIGQGSPEKVVELAEQALARAKEALAS